MRGIGLKLAPTSVVEGQLIAVSLLLHFDNNLYTTINPDPVYSLVRSPRRDDTRGIFWDRG